jgi:5-(carboxyamino)imidazole ribonucleotide mutase
MTPPLPEERPVTEKSARVSIIMGSVSDFEVMQHASKTLDSLGIENDVRVLSAHRTPDVAREYIGGLKDRGIRVLIAAAGGAAHLAGVAAAHTTLPVLGVPMQSPALQGLDSLLSTVQMPAGIPVATLAIGKAGAVNAALFAAAIIALSDADVDSALGKFRKDQTEKVLAIGDPRKT